MAGEAQSQSDFWEEHSQTSDTDAVVATWGFAPLWSAANPDDVPPAQETHE